MRKNKAVPLELPSFSKVNLRDFANRLKATGAQPALCRIQNDETCEPGALPSAKIGCRVIG
ncbi:hypothetical protein [Micromonospora sp. DT31]|uniref:hypothetical protein n=1 Tax=Micromonospora sp. DT31 TaxID=3393434 RepID=UPI003CE77BDF